jgi:hypothetical protein
METLFKWFGYSQNYSGVVELHWRVAKSPSKLGMEVEFSMGRGQGPINCVVKGRYAKKKEKKKLPYNFFFFFTFNFQPSSKLGMEVEFSMGRGQGPINCVVKGRYAKKRKEKKLPYKLLFFTFNLFIYF